MRSLLVIFCVCVLICFSAAAQDRLAVYGAGNMPCSGWLSGRERTSPSPEIRQLIFAGQMWILGYLSAANMYELHFRPEGPLTADSIFLWIDGYCRTHPNERLSTAIATMIAESRPKH